MADYGEVFKSADGWRWRIKASNNEVIATGESHRTKWGAKRAVSRVNPNIQIKEVLP